MAKGKLKSLYRRAFANQYNFILLAGAGLFAVATFSWVPLLIGAGVEALWLTLGADTPFFRKWVEKQESKDAREALEKRIAGAIHSLEPGYINRFRELEGLAQEIQDLAKENPSLDSYVIESEMSKLGKLLQSFLEMSLVHQRLGRYLSEDSEHEIDADIEACRAEIEKETRREVVSSLRQNLALAEKRQRQRAKIAGAHKVVAVKMDTLEKAFAYLKSHILAISKREELTTEIDDLIAGVDSVQDLASDDDLDELRQMRLSKEKAKAQTTRR